MATENIPFPLNTITSGGRLGIEYDPDLGKLYEVGDSAYILVKAGTGGIAAGSNGLVLQTAFQSTPSSGKASYNVTLNTIDANPFVVGVITSGITQAIASGQYFLALYAGDQAPVACVSGVVTGTTLVANSSSQLRIASTGTTAQAILEGCRASCGISTATVTGSTGQQIIVNFDAPWRVR